MSYPPARRSLAVLILAALLLVPWAASAAPRSTAELRAPSLRLISQLWSLFAGLWPDAGCILDPNGRCRGTQGTTASAPPASFEGCILDPSGRCKGTQGTAAPAPPASLDEGCGLDPSGRCGSR